VCCGFAEDMWEEKQRLAGYVKEVVAGCLAHQREDGLFHDVVDDRQTLCGNKPGADAGLHDYRGVRVVGWRIAIAPLPTACALQFMPGWMMRAWSGGCADRPTFDHSGTATEGQAFFLLMEAAYRDLSK